MSLQSLETFIGVTRAYIDLPINDNLRQMWNSLQRFLSNKHDPARRLRNTIEGLGNRFIFALFLSIFFEFFWQNEERVDIYGTSLQSHLSFIIRMFDSLIGTPSAKDCWISGWLKTDKGGYVSFKMTDLRPQWKPSQGTRLINTTGISSLYII